MNGVFGEYWVLAQPTWTVSEWKHSLPGTNQRCSYSSPCSFKFIVLNYFIISVKERKQNLVNHCGANKLEIPETSLSKQCLIWGSSLVNLYQVSETVSVIKLLSCSIIPIWPSNASGGWGLRLCKLHFYFDLHLH